MFGWQINSNTVIPKKLVDKERVRDLQLLMLIRGIV
jgi:hypothetical protein